MLNPEGDRLEYGNELLPPEGFRFTRAVATTYSLDFETLIAAIVPLALQGDIDDKELQTNPVAILQAVRKVVGRLVVFCEAGQIKVPAAHNKLASLLDNVIVEVALPRSGNRYPSFHPKTWLVEYENEEGEHVWRYVVLSRNLTRDQSWDVAVSLDGARKRGNYAMTRQILPFYKFLRGKVYKGAGTERQKAVVKDIISSLDEGVSFTLENPFDSIRVFPMGVDRSLMPPDIFRVDEPFDDLVVISPFLSETLIKKLNGDENESGCRKRVLISRSAAFGKLKPSDADRFRKYMLRGVATESAEIQDLHAKIYLRRVGSRTELWLGSANATVSGMRKNVEMMICLDCYNRYLNADKLLADICGGDPDGKASPLTEVTQTCCLSAEENDAMRGAEELVREICRFNMTGSVRSEDSRYRMALNFTGRMEFPGVMLRPINMAGNAVELVGETSIEFPASMELEDLSSLFVLSVGYDGGTIERVVKILVEGIPENRDDVVLNKVISDRSAFLRYMAMLLSSNPALALRKINEMGPLASRGGDSASIAGLISGLYEDMLLAAVDKPSRIQEVGEILDKIDGNDEELLRCRGMYLKFAEAMGAKTRKGLRDEWNV